MTPSSRTASTSHDGQSIIDSRFDYLIPWNSISRLADLVDAYLPGRDL